MKYSKIFEYLIENLDKVMTLTENFIYPYKGFDIRKLYEAESSYKRALFSLEKNNIIEKISEDKFRLTLLGKLEILKNQNKAVVFDPKTWDGKWRILAFDIPETKRRVREKLREYLWILGFKPIQKSIWVTPMDIDYQDFSGLFDEKTKEKLLFIVTNQISEEDKFKKIFRIKD